MGKRAVVKPLVLPKGRRVLAISDIHGNLPLLKGLLKKVAFSTDDILMILGDMLERSAGGLATLRYVMELSRTHTVHTLLGNCDNITLAFVDRGSELPDGLYESFLKRWGEKWTPVQMAREAGVRLGPPRQEPGAWAALAEAFRPELDFLRGLPQIYVNQDYLFVHGGVPREERLEELDAYGCMKNDSFRTQGHVFRRWVIVGHWPVTLYDERIPSAAPMFDREAHIISIDGGCTLKLDGQLNALILPEEPGGDFRWTAYDGLPAATALDGQAASEDSVNIRWGRSAVEVLERGEELSLCRHLESGRVLPILTEFLYERDGKVWCEDSTDYRLPVEPGDRLHVVRRLSDRTLAKKSGVTGWYFGRLT